MCMTSACVYARMPHVHGALGGQKESTDLPGTEVMTSVTHHMECWTPNLGPLQEQQVLLTAEPSLQSPVTSVFIHQAMHWHSWRVGEQVAKDAR